MKIVAAALGAALILLTPCMSSAKVSDQKYSELREDAFGAAQGIIVSAAADALSNVALQFSQGSGELATLVRQREDLSNQIEARRKQLERSFNDRSEGAAANQARIRKEEGDLSVQLDTVDQQIAQKFPGYSELTRPKPLASTAVQAILNPDEALLVIVPTSDATYLFVVTREHFDWARSSLKEADLVKAVTDLRQGLDASGRGDIPAQAAEQSAPAPAATASLVFHRQVAFQLYQELIAPLESIFSGKKVLFTATSGALQSIPLSVLVTQAPLGNDDDDAMLAQTHWLIDKYALVTLPAVSSLLTLRCYAPTITGRPHAGCTATQQGEVRPADRSSLAFAGIGAPVLTGNPDKTVRGAEDYSRYSRGEFSDVEALRRLPSLPGTADELRAIQGYFPSGTAVLRLGADATETRVKTDPDIAHARILDFATHALIADERQQIGEPGLVLTPPQTATQEDDGLLTASEAAQLKLSAEFVVLSACNTARRDGKLGADGLAGLARAFFYAGARAMLVSHWSVSDQATPVLMKGIFSSMKENPAGGRAIAFQMAIEDMKTKTHFVEPRYWAPFVLVGDTDEGY